MELIRPMEGYSNQGKAAPHLKPHSWGSEGKAVGFPNIGNRWRQFYVPADLAPLHILKQDGLQSRIGRGGTGNIVQTGHASCIWIYLATSILHQSCIWQLYLATSILHQSCIWQLYLATSILHQSCIWQLYLATSILHQTCIWQLYLASSILHQSCIWQLYLVTSIVIRRNIQTTHVQSNKTIFHPVVQYEYNYVFRPCMWAIFRLRFNLQISYTRCVGRLGEGWAGGTRSGRFNSGYRDLGMTQMGFF